MFHRSDEWLEDEQHLAMWRELATTDPHAPLSTHPTTLLTSSASQKLSHVYVSASDSKLERFALLREWAVPVGAKSLPMMKLRGLSVIGSHVLGTTDQESCATFVAAARERLAKRESSFLLFEELDTKSALWSALHESGAGFKAIYPEPAEPHWRVEIPEDADAYWQQQFSSKTRNTLKRKAKKLDGTLICYRSEAEAPLFLEAAQKVSAKSWQMLRLGRGLKGDGREIERLITLARLGALRSYVLERAGAPIAFVLGYQWNGSFVYENPGFDQDHADLSPGTVLLFKIMEHLFEVDRPSYVDFEAGFHDYKEQFGNLPGEDRTVYFVKERGLADRVLAFDRLRRRARTEIRTNVKAALQRAGVWQTLRNRYRGAPSRRT